MRHIKVLKVLRYYTSDAAQHYHSKPDTIQKRFIFFVPVLLVCVVFHYVESSCSPMSTFTFLQGSHTIKWLHLYHFAIDLFILPSQTVMWRVWTITTVNGRALCGHVVQPFQKVGKLNTNGHLNPESNAFVWPGWYICLFISLFLSLKCINLLFPWQPVQEA